MDNYSFDQCRLFLESAIQSNINNTEIIIKLLSSYDNLIQKKAEVDIQFLKSDAEVRKDFLKLEFERFNTSPKKNYDR